ncbi:MAG: glycine cleavage system aminomethyltransferase GcvT, partial [Christensenellaceae bacterium]
ESAETLWDALLEAGAEYGILPCGLGARDTLRLEGAMPLYGHEMNDEVLPYEAGIGFFVNLDKEDFIGRLKLAQKKETAQKRVGLK